METLNWPQLCPGAQAPLSASRACGGALGVWEPEPSLDLLHSPLSGMVVLSGLGGLKTEQEVRGGLRLLCKALWRPRVMGERPGSEGPGAEPVPLAAPLPQEAGSFGQKKPEPCPAPSRSGLRSQVGTERLSALPGQGVSPLASLRRNESLRAPGGWVSGAWAGQHGDAPGPGLAGALEGPCEGEGGGRLRRPLGREVQARWLPFLAVEFYPRRRHGGTRLGPRVYM